MIPWGKIGWGVLKYGWPVLVLASFFTLGYVTGVSRERQRTNTHALSEITRRLKEYQKVEAKVEKVKEGIRRSRKRKPQDDKRDSCLLSNDPFEKNCL